MFILKRDVTKKQNDKSIIAGVVLVLIITAWICSPPGNKFAQMCWVGSNAGYYIAKLNKIDVDEYLFHRNNAIYLAKMKKNKDAIKEMNAAIDTAPDFLSEKDIKNLYKDRAYINLYVGNEKEALNDFLRAAENLNLVDYLPVAILFAEYGHYQHAQYYCNSIINMNTSAYSGYACLAHLYEKMGRPETALKVWDYALSTCRTKSKIHISKAFVNKRMGDDAGFRQEMRKAQINQNMEDVKDTYIDDVLHPKFLTLKTTKLK